jgi:hypothetical protein
VARFTSSTVPTPQHLRRISPSQDLSSTHTHQVDGAACLPPMNSTSRSFLSEAINFISRQNDNTGDDTTVNSIRRYVMFRESAPLSGLPLPSSLRGSTGGWAHVTAAAASTPCSGELVHPGIVILRKNK